MNTKKICLLGSTGSIGTQTIQVARHLDLEISAISANSSVLKLEEQIREFSPSFCAVCNEDAAKDLAVRVADTDTKILSGKDCVCEMVASSDADTAVNSIIGFAGLLPTLTAIDTGKNIALANKETLVSAGEIVMSRVKEKGVSLMPIDSEHCAIHQCIANSRKDLKKILLTASGGSFFGKTKEELSLVTPQQAVCHPNWNMGNKITVDSGSLFNKGLELIEAMRLFDVREDEIECIVHRESVIHSMVEFTDNSVIAQLAVPDMRLCIQYALCSGEKAESLTPSLDLKAYGKLTFFDIDNETFPSVDLARRVARAGNVMPCIYNAANEAAVNLFLDGKIKFTDIFSLVEKAICNFENKLENVDLTIENVLSYDALARSYVCRSI